MVPGQVITQETIDFMRKLDVKEIHGYNNVQGLKLVRPEALARFVIATSPLNPAIGPPQGEKNDHDPRAMRTG